MSNVVFPPPGEPVPIPEGGLKRRKQSLANRYYDAFMASQQGGSQPAPHDVFTELVEDICFAIDLPTDTVDGNVLIRHLLYHLPTQNTPIVAQAVQLAFGACLPHLDLRNVAVHKGRLAYHKHVKYGSLPESYQSRGDTLYGNFRASLSTSTYQQREPYRSPRNLISMGEALAAISEFCEIEAEEFYEVSRGTTDKDVHQASTLLRAAITVRTLRELQDVTTFIEQCLDTVEDFAAGAGLNDHHNSKSKIKVTTGSYRRPGLQAGKWAKRAPDWVKDAQDYARGPDTTEDEVRALLRRPFPHEENEELRRRFHAKLKEVSKDAGYPRPSFILQAIYRTYDPYAGNSFGRSLVEVEKEAILWHMGKEDYQESFAGALRITCEEVALAHRKILRCLASYKNLGAAIAAVLLKYPNAPPARLTGQEIQALLQEARNEKKRQRLNGPGAAAEASTSAASTSSSKASGGKKGRRSGDAGNDAGKKKQKRQK